MAPGLCRSSSAYLSLDVSNTQCGSQGCSKLAEAVAQDAKLSQLNLGSKTGIGSEAVKQLAEAFATGASQTALYSCAHGGTLDAASIEHPRDAGTCVGLISLDLSGVSIDAAAMHAIAAIPSLRQLSLFSCQLGAEGE